MMRAVTIAYVGTEDVRGASQMSFSLFTGEVEFTHAMQDEHHGV